MKNLIINSKISKDLYKELEKGNYKASGSINDFSYLVISDSEEGLEISNMALVDLVWLSAMGSECMCCGSKTFTKEEVYMDSGFNNKVKFDLCPMCQDLAETDEEAFKELAFGDPEAIIRAINIIYGVEEDCIIDEEDLDYGIGVELRYQDYAKALYGITSDKEIV